jgi:hypothetical protein
MKSIQLSNSLIGAMSQVSWAKSLSVEEVCSWLESLGISEGTVTLFADNEVRGEDLLELTKEDLKDELGIKKIGERKRIFAEIQNILNPPESEEEEVISSQSPKKKVEEPIISPKDVEFKKTSKNDLLESTKEKDAKKSPTLEINENSETQKESPKEIRSNSTSVPVETIQEEKQQEIQKLERNSLKISQPTRPVESVKKRIQVTGISVKSLKEVKKKDFQKPYIKPLALPKTESPLLPPSIAPLIMEDVESDTETEIINESPATELSNLPPPQIPKEKEKKPKSLPSIKKRVKLPERMSEGYEQLISPRQAHTTIVSPGRMDDNLSASPRRSQSLSPLQSPKNSSSGYLTSDYIYAFLKEKEGRIHVTLTTAPLGGRRKKHPIIMPPQLPDSKAPEVRLSTTYNTETLNEDLGSFTLSTPDIFGHHDTRRKTVIEEYQKNLKKTKGVESKSFFEVIASPRTPLDLDSSIKSPKQEKTLKIEKEMFGRIVSNKGDSVAQFMRRGYRVMLFFLPYLGGSYCTHSLEDLYKCHRSLLQMNTIPLVVHLELLDKEREFFEGNGKKFNKIGSVSDYESDIHRAFKVDVINLPSVMGLFKGSFSKKESQCAAFVLEDFQVTAQYYSKKTPAERFDFLKFVMIPEDKSLHSKHQFNLSSGFKLSMIANSDSDSFTHSQLSPKRKFSVFKIQSDSYEDIQIYLKDVLSHDSRRAYLRMFIGKEGKLHHFLFYELIQDILPKESDSVKKSELIELMKNTFFNSYSIYYIGEDYSEMRKKFVNEGKLLEKDPDEDVFDLWAESYLYTTLKTIYEQKFTGTMLYREMTQLFPVSSQHEEFKRLKSGTSRNFSVEK